MIINKNKCSAYVCPRMVKSHNSCMGSGCMAWRWRKLPNPEYKYPSPNMFPQTMDPNILPYVYSDTEGYCGLAGSP